MSRKIQMPNGESLFEVVVREYNSGVTDYKELANKIGISNSTSATYLSRAKKQGLLNEKNTPFYKAIELYQSGIKDPSVIANKLGKSENTIKEYLKKARDLKIIQRELSLYERLIELYNSGITRHKELAVLLDISTSTIKKYVIRARKEGKLYKKSTYEKVVETFNNGVKDYSKIAENLNIGKYLVYKYIEKGRKEGKLLGDKKEKNIKEGNDKEPENNTKKSLNLLDSNIRIRFIKGTYPRNIAMQLGIPSRRVYDYLDGLSAEELSELRLARASNNLLFSKVKEAILSKETDLENLKLTLSNPKELVALARLYYTYGNYDEAEKILNNLSKTYNKNPEIVQLIFNEREKVHLEYLAIKVRMEYKKGKNIDGSKKTYDDLCKEFNVRNNFLVDVIGQEREQKEI